MNCPKKFLFYNKFLCKKKEKKNKQNTHLHIRSVSSHSLHKNDYMQLQLTEEGHVEFETVYY